MVPNCALSRSDNLRAMQPQHGIRCPKCQVVNPQGSRFCTNCGEGLTRGVRVQQPPPQASRPVADDPPHPKAIKFDRVPEEATLTRARDYLAASGKKSGSAEAGCLLLFGCASILIPVVGILVCIIAVGMAIWTFIKNDLIGPRVDQQQLAGLAYRWRNTRVGNCPICSAETYLFPGDDEEMAGNCPTCNAPLKLKDDWVWPV
jgi:hypothetical protein